MAIRNCQDIVARVAAEYPDEWKAAHTGGPRTEDFIRRLAWVLHSEVHPAFGLLGQNGDPHRIADDAIMYLGQGAGTDAGTGLPQSGFDVIVSAGSPAARPGWQDITGPGAAIWVQPTAPAGGAEPPPPVSDVWTAAHQAIVDRMRGRGVQEIAEQLAYTFRGWGRKRAGPGRPLSDDTVAWLMPDGHLYGVRVVPFVHQWGVLDAAHQFQDVAAVNHLGEPGPGQVDPPPPPPPPPVDPPPVDPSSVAAAVLAATAPRFDALHAEIAALRQQVLDAVRSQSYDIDANAGWVGRVRGTISPKQPGQE